jgi:hypothetical protein
MKCGIKAGKGEDLALSVAATRCALVPCISQASQRDRVFQLSRHVYLKFSDPCPKF